jgi:pyruvate/2-oxoglutarate/acetoin dehydrogenase E1 component
MVPKHLKELAEFEKRVIDTQYAELIYCCSGICEWTDEPIVEYMTFNFCLVGLTKL